jgi:hypothetical protein
MVWCLPGSQPQAGCPGSLSLKAISARVLGHGDTGIVAVDASLPAQVLDVTVIGKHVSERVPYPRDCRSCDQAACQ